DEAANVIKSGNLKDKVQIAKIECDSDEGGKVCADNGIKGYPTLIVYHKGKVLEQYLGIRTRDAIVDYLRNVVKTGKAQFVGKHIKTHQKMCMVKDYRKYVSHKS
uniref:protein disulfide isomerase family protein n=1 Tax=Salmonella sp. s54412 TaxID=3160128 RepID=UPI00375469D7